MGLLTNKRLILAKSEEIYGTDPTPTPDDDALLVNENIQPTRLNLQYANRSVVRSFFGASEQMPTNAYAMLEFEVEMTGMKDAGVPIASLSALLRACGLSETITEETSVAYAPVSDDFDSCTIYYNQDGVLQRLTGARGNVRFVMRNHEVPVMRFSMTGVFNSLTDAAQGTPDYSAFRQPLPVNNQNTSGYTLHGFEDGVLASLEIDLGNQVVFRSLVGGAEEVRITGRNASGSLSMEATKVAERNWIELIRQANLGALAITHGQAGNRCSIGAPKVQLTNPSDDDDEGVAMMGVDLVLMPDSGNDEIEITFS